MSFSERLKELREEKGLTQQDIADVLGVGRATIAGYETKGKQPDYEKLKKIADFFNVTIDYLLGRSNSREVKESNEYELTSEEKELLEKIKSDPELSILFHDLKNASKKKIKQLLKTWNFIQQEFDEWEDEENNNHK